MRTEAAQRVFPTEEIASFVRRDALPLSKFKEFLACRQPALDLMINAADIAGHTATVNGRLSVHSRHRCRAVTQS